MSSDIPYMPYDRRAEGNGTWTVFDAMTGRPLLGHKPAARLTAKDATELMDINRNTVAPAWRRLPRYAIQGLPEKKSRMNRDQA